MIILFSFMRVVPYLGCCEKRAEGVSGDLSQVSVAYARDWLVMKRKLGGESCAYSIATSRPYLALMK